MNDVTIQYTTVNGVWTTVARRRATGFFDGRTSSKSSSVFWYGDVDAGLQPGSCIEIKRLPLYVQEIVMAIVCLMRFEIGDIGENDVKQACGYYG